MAMVNVRRALVQSSETWLVGRWLDGRDVNASIWDYTLCAGLRSMGMQVRVTQESFRFSLAVHFASNL